MAGPQRADGLTVERVEGELLILKPGTQEAHALNETAALVFEQCDGRTSRAAMTAEVARRTGLPEDQGIVDLALADLAEAGLVVAEDAERPAVTRRSLIRQLALPVAAAALLPVVETMVVPAAAAGAPQPVPPPGPPPSPI